MHELTITGPCPARRMLLENGEHLIGRVPDSAIHLDGDGVSREHAQLEVQGGEATIVDLDSMNGTQVAGQSVERKRLDDGDVISIGRYRLLYRKTKDPADLTEVSEPEEDGAGALVLAGPQVPRKRDEGESAAPRANSSRGGTPSRLRFVEPPRWAGAGSGESSSNSDDDTPPASQRVPAQRPPAPRLALATEAAPAPPAPSVPVAERRRVPMNFRGRLAGTLLGLVVIAVLFIGYIVTALAEGMMAIDAQSRARALTYLLSEMNGNRLRSGDTRLITEPFLAEQGVRRALILDEKGAVLAPDSERGKTEPLFQTAQLSNDYQRQITPYGALISVPMVSGGRRYGTALIDFSIDYLKEKSAHIWTMTLMIGLFLGVLALLCSSVLEKMAHKPFLALASEVDLVVKGDLAGEVPLTTDVKANQLCEALNRLIRRAGERRAGGSEAVRVSGDALTGSLGLMEELLEVVGHGFLVVGEDGTLQLCNEVAAELLGCEVPETPGMHLLDALSESPGLNELLGLVKESRHAPGKTLQRRFRIQDLEARARTLLGERSQPTLISLERPA